MYGIVKAHRNFCLHSRNDTIKLQLLDTVSNIGSNIVKVDSVFRVSQFSSRGNLYFMIMIWFDFGFV